MIAHAVKARVLSTAKVTVLRWALRHMPLGERARLKVWMNLRVELVRRWKLYGEACGQERQAKENPASSVR